MALTDPISSFFPDIPQADNITIEHLLTHTSGLYEYTRGYDLPDKTENNFIRFLKNKPLDFSPGAAWSYCNTGYWLLGLIIEKVSGMSYEAAVRKMIFEPLKMNHSGFDFKKLEDQNKATGYETFSGQHQIEAEVYDAPDPYAARAIHATVDDLLKFHQGLQSHAILSSKSQEKAYNPFKNGYGYGWIIHDHDGCKVVSHSGGAAGFRSNLARIPDEDICIVLLDNTENARLEIITGKILDILFGKEVLIPSEIKLERQILEPYAGVFSVNPHFTMYISIEDGRLAAQVSGQPKTVLLAQKENYFYAEEANGFLEFHSLARERCDSLTIHQGGQHLPAKRIFPAWGLIGTATGKGWGDDRPDIPLEEDREQQGLWILEKIVLQEGEFKFRFNNDWMMNYGDNDTDDLPDAYGANIRVSAGTYRVILDLRTEERPRYQIERIR